MAAASLRQSAWRRRSGAALVRGRSGYGKAAVDAAGRTPGKRTAPRYYRFDLEFQGFRLQGMHPGRLPYVASVALSFITARQL